jgi:AmmeMemoRadiSam system protein B
LLATEAKLLRYKTSGDVTGDTSSVVGYAAVTFRK